MDQEWGIAFIGKRKRQAQAELASHGETCRIDAFYPNPDKPELKRVLSRKFLHKKQRVCWVGPTGKALFDFKELPDCESEANSTGSVVWFRV